MPGHNAPTTPRHDRNFGKIMGHRDSLQDSPTTFSASLGRLAIVRQNGTCNFFVRRFLFCFWVVHHCLVAVMSQSYQTETGDGRASVPRVTYVCRATVLQQLHFYRTRITRVNEYQIKTSPDNTRQLTMIPSLSHD